MTRLEFSLTTEVKHVGTLALIGTKDDLDGTTAHFVCQCPHNAPLARYFKSWCLDQPDGILHSCDIEEIDSIDGNFTLAFFERKLEGRLEIPHRLLESTARKLLRELQHAEDYELSLQEMDDQLNWADDQHYGNARPMTDFSRPRHV